MGWGVNTQIHHRFFWTLFHSPDKRSTLDPSYDIFACFKFSLFFLVFLHILYVSVAFSELLPMNKGEFKIQTEATYTFPD